MKSFIPQRKALLLLLVCAALSGVSQSRQSTWLAEGNLGNVQYDKTSTDYVATKNTNTLFRAKLSPLAAYFIGPKMALGSTIDYGYAHYGIKGYNENNMVIQTGNTTSHGIGFIPFIRYYIGEPKNKWQFFTQLGVGYVYGQQKSTYSSADGYGSSWFRSTSISHVQLVEAKLGLHYFITPQLAFTSSLGGNFSKSKVTGTNFMFYTNSANNDPTSYKSSNQNIGFLWNFGFTFFIGPGKN